MQKEARATASQQYQQHDSHRPHASPPVCSSLHHKLVAWHSGRTSVSDWQTFPVLRSTCKRVWENFYIIRLRAYGLLLQPRPSCTSRLTVPVLHRHHSMWPIICKYDVIHETGSAQRIATPAEEDRATDTGYMQKMW